MPEMTAGPLTGAAFYTDEHGEGWVLTQGQLYIMQPSHYETLRYLFGQPYQVKRADLYKIGRPTGQNTIQMFGGGGQVTRYFQKYGPKPPMPGDPGVRLIVTFEGQHYMLENGRVWGVNYNQAQELAKIYGKPERVGSKKWAHNQGIYHGNVGGLFGVNDSSVGASYMIRQWREDNAAVLDPSTGDPGDGTGVGDDEEPDYTNERNAQAELKEVLSNWFGPQDADALSEFAWDMIIEGATQTQVIQNLREHEVYKRRFPGMELRKQAGLPAINEATYIEYENQAHQLMSAAKMPPGFYDSPDDFAQFIGGNVSIQELSQRVQDGYTRSKNADPRVREELERLYGVGTGALAAFYLDPERAWDSIQQSLRAAEIGASARRSRFGTLSQQQAERLAQLNVTQEEAQQGFGQLAANRQLFGRQVGEYGTENISQDDQIAAAFEDDAEASARILRQRDRRTSQFRGGGGAAAQNSGVTGLGRANY